MTRSAEPEAPTPLRKFRQRAFAEQNADTAPAEMVFATTCSPALVATPAPVPLVEMAEPSTIPGFVV